MMRILPILVVLGFIVVVALTFLVAIPAVERRARRHRVRDDVDADTLKWQSKLTCDDIERHRARMNRNLDEQFDE